MHDNKTYINDYPLWRADYWNEYDKHVLQGTIEDERFVAVNGHKPEWTKDKRPVANYTRNPAHGTIRADIRIFNRIMRYAADNKMMKYPELMKLDNYQEGH